MKRTRNGFAVRALALAVPIAVVWPGTSVSAWENDVHYGLTKLLAIQAGFTIAEAETIAAANHGVDSSLLTSPIPATIYACTTKTPGPDGVNTHHFPSRVNTEAPSKNRGVDAGVVWRAKRQEPPPIVEGPEDLADLGHYLHALQDSWSHQHIPDVPPICDDGFGWGHAVRRGGWSCHLADLTYYWRDAPTMVGATFDVLAKASKKARVTTSGPGVEDFLRASTKKAKDAWFRDQNLPAKTGKPTPIFPNRDFLQGLSLPDCELTDPQCQAFPFEKNIEQWMASSPAGRRTAEVPVAVFRMIGNFVQYMRTGAGDSLPDSLDQRLAELALARSLGVSGSCPALFQALAPIMLTTGFIKGWGAQQPLALCELAAENSLKAPGRPLSCSEAVARLPQAIAERVRRGPGLQAVDAMLLGSRPPTPPETPVPPFDYTVMRDRRGDGYVAIARFAHLPSDQLLITANQTSITGFNWMARQ